MLTKNGRNAITAAITGQYYSYAWKARSGDTETLDPSDIRTDLAPGANSDGYCTVLDLTSDTTAVTEDTYDLGTLITGVDATTYTRTKDSRGRMVYTYSGTNTNSSAITVNKIGLRMRTASSSSSFDHNFYIVAENITPRVIQPGETYSFTIVI